MFFVIDISGETDYSPFSTIVVNDDGKSEEF